jgi:hypothetical protein
VKYGGLKRDGDTEFSAEDAEITEVVVKASSTETIEIEATEVQNNIRIALLSYTMVFIEKTISE